VLAKRREVAAKAKGKEQLSKELRSLEAARAELRTQIETVASAALTIEHEVALERRETASQVRAREGLVAELATLQKALRSVGDSTREQLDLSKVHAEAIRSLEEETGTCQAEAAQQKKAIQQLERSRARFGAEASEGVERFRAAVSQIKVQDASIRELHKTIADGEAKLKAQQDVYEAVRSDRNQYSKSLVETQDDLAEMKRKFKIVHHQVDQLKDEVKAKDQARPRAAARRGALPEGAVEAAPPAAILQYRPSSRSISSTPARRSARRASRASSAASGSARAARRSACAASSRSWPA